MIDLSHFQAVDMRVGRVISVEEFPEARVPARDLTIDFGPPGLGVALLRPDRGAAVGSRIA